MYIQRGSWSRFSSDSELLPVELESFLAPENKGNNFHLLDELVDGFSTPQPFLGVGGITVGERRSSRLRSSWV